MNVYEVHQGYEAIIQKCRIYAEEHEGELSLELAEELESFTMEKEQKIVNMMHFFKNESATQEAIEKEIELLKKRSKSHANNIEWIKAWLTALVGAKNKLEFPTGKIGWRSSISVSIINAASIPKNYFRIIPEKKEPDKNLIKEALLDGKKIKGVELVENQNIQIN